MVAYSSKRTLFRLRNPVPDIKSGSRHGLVTGALIANILAQTLHFPMGRDRYGQTLLNDRFQHSGGLVGTFDRYYIQPWGEVGAYAHQGLCAVILLPMAQAAM